MFVCEACSPLPVAMHGLSKQCLLPPRAQPFLLGHAVLDREPIEHIHVTCARRNTSSSLLGHTVDLFFTASKLISVWFMARYFCILGRLPCMSAHRFHRSATRCTILLLRYSQTLCLVEERTFCISGRRTCMSARRSHRSAKPFIILPIYDFLTHFYLVPGKNFVQPRAANPACPPVVLRGRPHCLLCCIAVQIHIYSVQAGTCCISGRQSSESTVT